LQDNGVWGGPSATLDTQGIINEDWYLVGYGDGFCAQVNPADPNIVYANSQMNGLYRYDKRIRKSKTIKPLASLKKPPYRFNWNSPIHISPHDPETIYTGGNVLFRSCDRGQSWEVISPDLSTNDPEKQKDSGGPITPDNTGAEIHCTIITISESPVEKGVIWCGTDDGNLQVTRDGGATWTNVVKNIRGLPPNTWCSRVEASHFDPGTAYAAFDGHRNDDMSTYLFKTTDYGATWTSIKGNLPFGWVHVVREDLRNKNLLFVGTEFGIYASLDGGTTWFSLQNNLPTVAVRDIAVHPRENDLIIGTHGRGIWILDDITPLQEMNESVLSSDLHLFSIRPTTEFFLSSSGEPSSRPVFAGKNPEYGMIFNVYLKEKPKEKPRITIKNPEGEGIFEITLPARKGIIRNTWNLQFVPKTKDGKLIKPTGIGFVTLPLVFPGEYEVAVTAEGHSAVQKGVVLPDPRFPVERKTWEAQVLAQAEVNKMSKLLGLSVTAANRIRREIQAIEK
ncbi:MAG: WD40/YVTN/BNR-like repeat-containing protein, partial [Candidatus Aminicenantales bacterium]